MSHSTTMTAKAPAASTSTNPWKAALWGGVITAVIAAGFSLLLPMSMPFLWIPALWLIGVGPVLGYQIAAGQLGSDWKSLIGGLLGGIIPFLGQLILWPLFVWLFNRKFSFGRLFLGSLIGLVLGVVVFFVVGMLMGQDPYLWVGPAWALGVSMWGGAAAAAMPGRE